jgi:uncharacterized membrane protein
MVQEKQEEIKSDVQGNDGKELLTTDRVMTLTDGIFAIAMTLLVLSIDVPDKKTVQGGLELRQYLIGLYPQFFNYFLSFYLLSRIWIILHRGYHEIKRTDTTHIWINIGLMAFVCLVPFSTSLDAEYNSDVLAASVFHVNMFAVASLCYWNWAYASKNHRLIRAGLSAEAVELAKKKLRIFPLAALVALLVAQVSPSNSALIYLLIPAAIRFLFRSRRVTRHGTE